jgi:hypothetical protein
MTAVVRLPTHNHSSYDPADLVRTRRDNLQYARSLPLALNKISIDRLPRHFDRS